MPAAVVSNCVDNYNPHYLEVSAINRIFSCASTAQHSTAQHSTAQHSTAQHSTAQHSTNPVIKKSEAGNSPLFAAHPRHHCERLHTPLRMSAYPIANVCIPHCECPHTPLRMSAYPIANVCIPHCECLHNKKEKLLFVNYKLITKNYVRK